MLFWEHVMANCAVFLCFVVDSTIGTATDSPQWTSLNFFFGYSYFIFKIDFSKQSTKAEGRHPEGGVRIVLTKEVWKFS